MPTYEYACTECGQHLEVVQSFSDDSLTTCPACGGPLRKVFGNIGIVLKGSGFYKTDSRPAKSSAKSSSDAGDSKKSSDGDSSSSKTKESTAASSTTSSSGDAGAPAAKSAAT
jgi:putative FmdB family regulatory protein